MLLLLLLRLTTTTVTPRHAIFNERETTPVEPTAAKAAATPGTAAINCSDVELAAMVHDETVNTKDEATPKAAQEPEEERVTIVQPHAQMNMTLTVVVPPMVPLLATAMPMLLEALEEPPLEGEEDDMLHCMAARVTL